MKLNDVKLYGPVYRGRKLTYNTSRGRGMLVEGIAVDTTPELNVIIIRDRENFAHAINADYAEEVSSVEKK